MSTEPPKVPKKRIGCIIGAVVFVALAFWVGPVLISLWGVIFGGSDPERSYQGDSIDNLKAMYTAMNLYHESEGQFPQAAGWMDAIEPRIVTADLKRGEAEKKLIRPALRGNRSQFGYAMSDAASGKYKDDLKDKKMPLIFESTPTERNAHGDPAKLRRAHGLAVSVDGTILK